MAPKLDHIKNVFCVGIGGIGMSALARFWKHAGKNVAGYDLRETELTQRLVSESISVFYSDNPELIPAEFLTGDTLVVRTPAVPDDLEVLLVWEKVGKTVLRRSQMLALIASEHIVYAVAGTHGKTTITTMLGHLLNQRPQKINAFMGGISRNYGTNLLLSSKTSEMVIEADEYDKAFLRLNPNSAIITSIDADHLDIYHTFENVILAFNEFADRVSHHGVLFYKKGIMLLGKRDVDTYSYHAEDSKADFYAKNHVINDGCYGFDLVTPKGVYESLQLGIPGFYNLENAVAASAMALEAGLSYELLKTGLETFMGVERRFELHNKGNETYVDDYAHHPREIEACLGSLRRIFPGRHITAIFQPHLFSRTKDLHGEFIVALEKADTAIVTDIYPARELPIAGVTAHTLLAEMKNGQYVAFGDLLEFVKTQKFDILVTMGAGNIGDKALQIKQILDKRA
jgi:UDP-N-acetylmuramate--alanine ligase